MFRKIVLLGTCLLTERMYASQMISPNHQQITPQKNNTQNGTVATAKTDNKLKKTKKAINAAIYGATGFWLYITLKSFEPLYRNKFESTINQVLSQSFSFGLATTILAELYLVKLHLWLQSHNQKNIEITIPAEEIILFIAGMACGAAVTNIEKRRELYCYYHKFIQTMKEKYPNQHWDKIKYAYNTPNQGFYAENDELINIPHKNSLQRTADEGIMLHELGHIIFHEKYSHLHNFIPAFIYNRVNEIYADKYTCKHADKEALQKFYQFFQALADEDQKRPIHEYYYLRYLDPAHPPNAKRAARAKQALDQRFSS